MNVFFEQFDIMIVSSVFLLTALFCINTAPKDLDQNTRSV